MANLKIMPHLYKGFPTWFVWDEDSKEEICRCSTDEAAEAVIQGYEFGMNEVDYREWKAQEAFSRGYKFSGSKFYYEEKEIKEAWIEGYKLAGTEQKREK